jgi:hypothetical protein
MAKASSNDSGAKDDDAKDDDAKDDGVDKNVASALVLVNCREGPPAVFRSITDGVTCKHLT